MGENTPPSRGAGAPRRWAVSVALVTAGLAAGGILAGTQIAGAEDATAAATPTTSVGSSVAPAALRHGPGEQLITGSEAKRVEAAALDEVPGGTVLRVETDSEGSPYEAHVRTSDGSVVTVKVDEDFNVTDTVNGFGAAPHRVPSGDASA